MYWVCSKKYRIIKKQTLLLYLSIDLRWNNIGLVGSRALLASCQSNSTLSELHLVGNNIPDDIMENISKYLFVCTSSNTNDVIFFI